MLDLSNYNFQNAFSFIETQGYALMFLLMIIEGPIITAASAFAASLGYFNVFIVLILSITADIVADTAYFFIGASGLKKLLKRYLNGSARRKKRMAAIERHLKNHPIKTVIAIKLTPFAVPGLVALGSSKLPFKKYILACAMMIVPSAIAFTSIGYFFGYAFDKYSSYLGLGKEILLVAMIIVIVISIYAKRAYPALAKKLDKDSIEKRMN